MLKQQLQQKLQQKLSPQQIQLIRLLELPAIELEERIKHELEDNPALEEGKEIADDFDRTDEGGEELAANEMEGESETDTDLSLGDYMSEDDIPDYKLRELNERAEKKEDVPFSVSESLNEYLLQQLGLRDLPEKQVKIAEYIIGNIDDDGYLRRDLSAIADDLVFQAGQDVTEKEIETVLAIIQDFDPAGVGARNLQECLLLQLARREKTSETVSFIPNLTHKTISPFCVRKKQSILRLTALNCLYSKINISSIGAFTALEISIANLSDGLYCAFSNLIIVSRRTPTMSASCSCVNSCATRYFFKLHTNFASIIYSLFS